MVDLASAIAEKRARGRAIYGHGMVIRMSSHLAASRCGCHEEEGKRAVESNVCTPVRTIESASRGETPEPAAAAERYSSRLLVR